MASIVLVGVHMSTYERDDVLPVVVILTAISIEYRAVRSNLKNIKEDKSDDGRIYEVGELHSDGRAWKVVIRETGPGNVDAANAVHLCCDRYNPDVVIFCGIAGGIKDVSIGDVVVPTKVYNYHSGKYEANFFSRPETYSPSLAILERAKMEAQDLDWHDAPTGLEQSARGINVFTKPIASGEEVVASKNSETLKRIKAHYNDAIAIDMEGYGFLCATDKRGVNERLLVRGISDLLDQKEKSDIDGSQQLAAGNAAAFVFKVLKKFQPRSPISRISLIEVQSPQKEDETASHKTGQITENGSKSNNSIEELRVVEHFRDELNKRGIFKIGIEERIRLFVLAGSLLPHDVRFSELGNHLLHKMYLYRSTLNLTSNEQYLIYTTLLRDSWNYKTGWFWLRKIRSKRIVQVLEEEATSEAGDDRSREGAIRILQVLDPTKAEKSLAKIVTKCEHMQKRNILDYLFVHGSMKSLDTVDRLTVGEHEGVTSKAILAKIAILSRHEPAQAVRLMIEESKKDVNICTEASLGKIVNLMSTRNLKKLAANKFLCGLKELAKRRKATEAELKTMLEADVPELRYLGYSGLLKQGFEFNPNNIQDKWPKSKSGGVWGFLGPSYTYKIQGMNWLVRTLLEVYSNIPLNQLEGSVESKRQRGVVYLAWGLRGGRSVVQVVRNDLENSFKRHKKNLLTKIEETSGNTEEVRRSRDSLQKAEHSLTLELTASALKVLEKHGKPRDKIVAKQFLKSDDAQVRAAAVGLFVKYARKSDIDVLLEIVNGQDVECQTIAARRILKLNVAEEHRQSLLDSILPHVVKEAVLWCIENEKELSRTEICRILHSKDDDSRLLGIAYAVKTFSRQRLLSLLAQYVDGQSYYYDVVCWLDRVLYAPKDLAEGYKKKLVEKLANLAELTQNHRSLMG